MKFMSTWALLPGTVQESVDRFLAGEAAPVEGVTLLGRWHNIDCSGGWSPRTRAPASLSLTQITCPICRRRTSWPRLSTDSRRTHLQSPDGSQSEKVVLILGK